LAKALGTRVNMIPYRGATPALTDIVAGHADLYFGTPASTGDLIRAGKVKAFAVTSKERTASLPDVPSFVALGYADLDIEFWQAVFAPAAVPKPALERLAKALRLALADPTIAKSFEDTGMGLFAPDRRTPAAANALLLSEIKRWGNVIRANKLDASQ